jgi:enoyl-CoA hydratase/carnithine racemase
MEELMPMISVRDDGLVRIITIDRPDKANAINKEMAVALQAAFVAFEASEQRVAILTGTGDKAFSTGADMRDIPEIWRMMPTVGFKSQKPIIAAVTGWCVGGAFMTVVMCDLCVATESTRFSYPEGRIGHTGGVAAGLAGRIPHKIAMELLFLGEAIDARRAYEVGLVNRIVPDGEHLTQALVMAHQLAGYAPMVMSMLKRFVTESILPKGPSERMLAAQLDVRAVMDSEDMREGLKAFQEKRTPKYVGR